MRYSVLLATLLGTLYARPTAALEASNLDLVTQTAQQAVRNALSDLQLPTPASPIAVASASTHSPNRLFDPLLLEDSPAPAFQCGATDRFC